MAVAVSVLIVTCPCALSLAAPSALLAAASALARRGVLLRRLDALEALAQVQRVYFDKTGTVTDEQLQCTGLVRCPAGGATAGDALLSDAVLWAHAASLAGWSSHPLARALALKQGEMQASVGDPGGPDGPGAVPQWRDLQEAPGQGLQATDASGRCWRLGRADAEASPAASSAAEPPADGRAATWLACDGRLLARFDFDETLRPDARATVQALQARGLQVVLLSGDQPGRAQRMGALLGVCAVIGGATPERKLAEVAAAQAQGWRVAMVGDGINDAPVLARADLSFAMGQGALVARAQADAVLVSNRLADLLLAHTLARRTMRVVRQNLVWAAAYNSACIPLALAGWLPPWAAGLGMASSSLGVILNAVRLAR